MQARLHKAAQTFNGFVGDIHATDINRWLVGMRHLSGITKNNYRDWRWLRSEMAHGDSLLTAPEKLQKITYARTTEPRATVFSGYSCVASDAPRKSEYSTGPPMRVGIEGTPWSL